MNNNSKPESKPVRLRWYVLVLVATWTAFIAMVLLWNLFQQRRETLEVAIHDAQTSFEKDLVYRRWAAGHGGVYVPVSEQTPPNPYLSHIKERDITTPSGRQLTLINPAYMTRQVHELGAEQSGLRGHITSLNPIRAENAADPWEKEALKSFEQGAAEVSSVEELNGHSYMRLMRPLIIEERCLKCHAAQGYKVGDIRGGISVSIPMEPLYAIARGQAAALVLGHSFLWILGLSGIGLGARRLRHRIRERDQAEKMVMQANQQLEKKTSVLIQSEKRLQIKISEVEQFNKLAVGRELRMIELKKEVDALLREFGREEKYKSDYENIVSEPYKLK